VSSIKAAAVSFILACAIAIPVQATIITVTNTNDTAPGSLRQALMDSNDGDIIDATGVSGVITLALGELLVQKSVTINGAGADVLAVEGNTNIRVFQIGADETVTISDLTIRNGQGDFGGGILNGAASALTITNSTLSGNFGAFGGAAYNEGTLSIVNSTVSGNTSNEGGGIYNASTLTITNSTLSGNSAGGGGAIINLGAVLITNSTLSGNSANFAGGVFDLGTLQIGNTILNAGASGVNIYSNGAGGVMSLGYNISSDNGNGFLNGPGDQVNTDPLLGPLQDNGGPTFTHALLPGSPAINAGDPGFTPPPFFDQRGPGFDRVVSGRLDIGSFEVQSSATPTPTPTATSTPTSTATSSPTATATASATSTPTPTPTVTATSTPSPTATVSPSVTPTASPRPSPTPRGIPTPRPRVTPAPRPKSPL
jgi:hypothetical protein